MLCETIGRWCLLCSLALLAACGTPYATMKNNAGDDVMLLGHDPVAYFTQSQSVRGDPAIKSTLPGRTYYFTNTEHKRSFDAAPAQFEPQYGGFCASGAAYALKLGSDPTEWHIIHGLGAGCAVEHPARRSGVARGQRCWLAWPNAQTLRQ
jgi:YHS domain-containing protein